MASLKTLLFVDTNIWLDFYRPQGTDTIIKNLGHLEDVQDRIIVTHQLEMEYKKNRHVAMLEGLRALKVPTAVTTLGIFSDAAATRAIDRIASPSALNWTSLKNESNAC